MTRDEIYHEIKQQMGEIPTPFKQMPDNVLEGEWIIWKNNRLRENSIPMMYRDLICLAAAAAAAGNRYSVFLQTEMAKMHGATDAQIQEAVYQSKVESGWRPYAQGLQMDFNEFREETRRILEYVRAKEEAEPKPSI